MKLIKKESVVELPEASGSIADTWNIENKVTNAPSMRLVEEALKNAPKVLTTEDILLEIRDLLKNKE